MKFRKSTTKSATDTELAASDSDQYVYWFEYVSGEQARKVDQFKKSVLALPERDSVLEKETDFARFLKARQWDEEKALTMYQNTVRWRKEFGTDQIFKTFSFPEKKEVLKIFPQYYLRTVSTPRRLDP